MTDAPFDYVWRWRTALPDRHGTPCRVLQRRKTNPPTALVEFEDGFTYWANTYALKSRPPVAAG